MPFVWIKSLMLHNTVYDVTIRGVNLHDVSMFVNYQEKILQS